ncbi:hypothetical protein FRC11_005355, partial [Ceratobasidium sp. 423]
SLSILQWEEAGALLATALTKYLNLSLSLRQNSLSKNISSAYLAARIDSALGSLHPVLDRQISQARSTLAQTRNRIMSPICCFPEEVLSEIFVHVITASISVYRWSRYDDRMEQSVIHMYRELHTLLGVCSVWRDVAINRSRLWSIIPFVDPLPRSRTWKTARSARIIKSSIERAGEGDLYLAVTQPCDARLFASLREFASRFHTVNIDAGTGQSTISVAMDMFLHHHSPGPLALSELSLRQQRDSAYFQRVPQEGDFLFAPPSSQEQASFTELVQNISILRISGVQLNWGVMAFSHRLTQVHLQNVLLGYDSALGTVFGALSSATALRDLKLISITTLYDITIGTEARIPEAPTVWLPNLQSLVVQHLYYNTLNFLFSLVDLRGLHSLTLVLNENCHCHHLPGSRGIEVFDPEDLDFLVLLDDIPLKTLLVDGTGDTLNHWLSPLQLESLLKSVPTLETLYLRSFPFDDEYCRAMKRSSQTHDFPFPRITELYITCASIQDKVAFKDMITSHLGSIQHVEVGGAVYAEPEDLVESMPLEEDEELVNWLEDKVQSFRLLDKVYYPPQFDEPVWQLW